MKQMIGVTLYLHPMSPLRNTAYKTPESRSGDSVETLITIFILADQLCRYSSARFFGVEGFCFGKAL